MSLAPKLPFFDQLESAQNILVAGMGGGFDIFTGLPLYFMLQAAGKNVHLANLSFSTLFASNGAVLAPALVEVTAKTEAHLRYFPELYLARRAATWGHGVCSAKCRKHKNTSRPSVRFLR